MTRKRLHKVQGRSGYGNNERRLEDKGTMYSNSVLEVHLVGSEDGNGTNWRELHVLLRLSIIGTGAEGCARVVGPVLLQIGEGEYEQLVVVRDEGWRGLDE
jgi:hypothetical protein